MVLREGAATLPSSSRFPATVFATSPLPLRPKAIAILGAPRAAAGRHASLSSLRPPTRRANRLRPKLLKTLTPLPPHPVREAPQSPVEGGAGWEDDLRVPQFTLLPPSVEVPTDSHAFVLEEGESTTLMVRHQVGDRPSQSDAFGQRGVIRLLLELSVYLVGLLAVQTVCAIWFFGGAIVGEGESTSTGTCALVNNLSLKKEAGPEVGEHELDFEQTVLAIRAMAKEARAAEARKASEEDGVAGLRGDIMGEVNRRLGRLRKRVPRVHLDAKVLSNTMATGKGSKAHETPAKGFDGSRDRAASSRDLRNGGDQSIGHDSHFRKPSQPRVRRKSKAHGYNAPEEETASSRDLVLSNSKNFQTFGNKNASDQGIIEKSRNDHNTAIGGILDNLVPQDLVEDGSTIGEGIHYEQTGISNNGLGRDFKTENIGMLYSQSFLGKKHGPSSTYKNSYTNPEIVSDKKTEDRHLREKVEDSQSDAINKLWWLKLPYVLGIFLHRGSDRKEFRGLYSLKLDSSSEEESHSYTIVFQDRVDATNLCYLLESFFENLDDFFAEIVPLSIQEVHDAVKSRTLKVIVVRKGQLQLYAGQPLAEAEMQLRSMLD